MLPVFPSVHNASALLFQAGGLNIQGTAQVTMTHCKVYSNTATWVSASPTYFNTPFRRTLAFQCPTEINLVWVPADLMCAMLRSP